MGLIGKAGRALALALGAALAAAVVAPSPAMADSSRMVTLGADLTDSERGKVLQFFSLSEADLEQMEVITVTNQDERRYLEGTLSDDVIGWKTYSCSYIEPKTSGGLHVETANLTYVTKNTLYNALQTAGVQNASLVVTAPYPVSGTGALTGVFMAYERRGASLDEAKKQAATQELVQTASLEGKHGEGVAEVISEVKDKVVSADHELSDDEIRELIKLAAKTRGIDLSDEDVSTILDLVRQVQGLDYDVDAFSNTLEDFRKAVGDATAKADEAKGFFEAIADWFQGVIDWFKGLFGAATDAGKEAAKNGDDLIEGLNTDVFSLDDPSKEGGEAGAEASSPAQPVEQAPVADGQADGEAGGEQSAPTDAEPVPVAQVYQEGEQ